LDKETFFLAGNRKQQNNPLPARLNHFFWKMMDWIYPPACPGCQALGFRFCPDCQSQINYLHDPICSKCGQPVSDSREKYCSSCVEHEPGFTKLQSVTIYDGAIRSAILQMKFNQDFGISEFLGEKITDLFLDQLQWDIDFIVPVPLSKERQKSRGFNQSYRLALPLSLRTRLPIKCDALNRTVNTLTQSDLPKHERLSNVKNAFSSKVNYVQGKKILIIDDVATTSSTISACSIALLDNGAKAVFGITAARAVL
jgi:ComF family protein